MVENLQNQTNFKLANYSQELAVFSAEPLCEESLIALRYSHPLSPSGPPATSDVGQNPARSDRSPVELPPYDRTRSIRN